MIDYEKKYLELTNGFLKCIDDVSDEFPDANGFEKTIIALRRKGWNYVNIQKKLGMPSKKQIGDALRKWAPNLVDNSKKKESKLSKWESELYSIVIKNNPLKIEFEEEPYEFYIQNNTLWYKEEDGTITAFRDINEIMQQQFLITIKEQINERFN